MRRGTEPSQCIILKLLNQLNTHNSHINITYIAATCFGVQNTIFREHVMPSLKPIVSKQATFMVTNSVGCVGDVIIIYNCINLIHTAKTLKYN
jgi:hypothetical protein